jgi:integrase
VRPGDGGDHPDGPHRDSERFARHFAGQVTQARKALGEERLPVIRLHDLRRTHATLLLADGVPGGGRLRATGARERHHHADRPPARAPGMGREAADRFGALLKG